MFQINDTMLITDGGILYFSNPIDEVLEVGETIVVRLEIMGQGADINNIYGVKGGHIIWQVQDMRE